MLKEEVEDFSADGGGQIQEGKWQALLEDERDVSSVWAIIEFGLSDMSALVARRSQMVRT